MSKGKRPRRIQRQRTRGWRMPANTVYVGRPTEWGNPWIVGLAVCGCRSAGECMHNIFNRATAAEAVQSYREWANAAPRLRERARRELRGKNLACWCPLNRPCHADILLEIANG